MVSFAALAPMTGGLSIRLCEDEGRRNQYAARLISSENTRKPDNETARHFTSLYASKMVTYTQRVMSGTDYDR